MTAIRIHNRKMVQARDGGHWAIRVHHRKARGGRMPRYLLKCGCCSQQLEICYSGEGLEINGVAGSIENWREILLPLLKVR